MAKKKQRSGYEEKEQYIRYEYKMINSAAFQVLQVKYPKARCLLDELLRRWDYETKHSRIPLSYHNVEWMMSSRTFFEMMEKLQELGFIRLVDKGSFDRGQPSIYAIVNDWLKKSREIVKEQGREAWMHEKRKRRHEERSERYKREKNAKKKATTLPVLRKRIANKKTAYQETSRNRMKGLKKWNNS
jgi:hypothetical protein